MPSLSRAEIFSITVFTILAFTWFGRIALGFIPSHQKSNSDFDTENIKQAEKIIVVHIAGAVERPGIYELPIGSRINDALKVAGGAVLNADVSLLNLAENLSDEDKIYIPLKGESIPAGFEKKNQKETKSKSANSPRNPVSIININTATLEQLMSLPDIGEVRAEEIINYRVQHGGFKKREEIMNVRGIGEGIYEKIKNLIYV